LLQGSPVDGGQRNGHNLRVTPSGGRGTRVVWLCIIALAVFAFALYRRVEALEAQVRALTNRPIVAPARERAPDSTAPPAPPSPLEPAKPAVPAYRPAAIAAGL
jgi:hypothetical protein